jgi:hypothetical protein
MVVATRTKRRRWRRWKKKRHSPAERHLYVSCPAGAAVVKAPLLLLLLLPSLLFLRLRLPPLLLLLSLFLLHLLVLLLLLLLPLPPKRVKVRPGRLRMDAKPRRRMEGGNRATRTNFLADLTTANKLNLLLTIML